MRVRTRGSLTENERKKALDLRGDGYSLGAIAQRFGVGRTLVFRICKDSEKKATKKPVDDRAD